MTAVPYGRLRDAETRARQAFPDAHDVRALWTPASSEPIHVEVFSEPARARVLPASALPAPEREAA